MYQEVIKKSIKPNKTPKKQKKTIRPNKKTQKTPGCLKKQFFANPDIGYFFINYLDE